MIQINNILKIRRKALSDKMEKIACDISSYSNCLRTNHLPKDEAERRHKEWQKEYNKSSREKLAELERHRIEFNKIDKQLNA